LVTNQQLYLAIGVPLIVNLAFHTLVFVALSNRITQLEISLKETWRAELRRVEEVLDARLKHLEERFR
jgi:hypothetical protein